MNIRQRIILLIALTFAAIAAIGGIAILQSGNSAVAVRAVTEGVVPSALAAGDLVASIKDVQLTAISMVSAADDNAAERAAEILKQLQAQIAQAVDLQSQAADSDAQRGLIAQAQESLKNYFKSIDETTRFKLAGQKEMAEAFLFANVAEYQTELSGIVETLRIEKNRRKDAAILSLNDKLGQVVRGISLVTLVAVLVLGSVSSFLYLRITRPLKQLQDAIETIRTNLDLTHRIPVAGNSEIDRVIANAGEARHAGGSIVQIRSESEHVVEVSSEIATALNEQSSATELTAIQIEKIASMSEKNTAVTGEVKKVSVDVKRLSPELYRLVARFQVWGQG